jgi:hypothetical protein
MVTPRLALVSPVRGCGKTTVLLLLELLVARGRKEDGISAAAIFRLIGGSLTRVIKDRPRRFLTFAPMGIAAIGALLLPIMHRSLIVPMKRATRKLRQFNESDLDDVNIAYAMVLRWAKEVQLNLDPELPEGLRNRPADNWRPLIAIADSFGPAWGVIAREAAVEFARTYRDEDAGVILLNDIRGIFAARGDDRLTLPTWSRSMTVSGRSGAVRTAISSRGACPRESSRDCWRRSGSDRERSGQFSVARPARVQRVISAGNSRRHGRRTAPRTSHRHSRAISDIFAAGDPAHLRHTWRRSDSRHVASVLHVISGNEWQPLKTLGNFR